MARLLAPPGAMTRPGLSRTCLERINYGSALRENGHNSPVDTAAGVWESRAMLGEPEEQFSLTRAVPSTSGRATKQIPAIRHSALWKRLSEGTNPVYAGDCMCSSTRPEWSLKPMNKLQPNSILNLLLVVVLMILPAALRGQPQLTAAQLAALTPLDPTAVPSTGS
jgi:hypothetical protein